MAFLYENLDAETRSAMLAELDGDVLAGRLFIPKRLTRGGGMTRARVPPNAAHIIAGGEFNRFYIRGLCLRRLGEGGAQVQVYRARPSAVPRLSSEMRIGMLLDAQALLDDLRQHADGTEPTVLPEVNSGLSVRIPD